MTSMMSAGIMILASHTTNAAVCIKWTLRKSMARCRSPKHVDTFAEIPMLEQVTMILVMSITLQAPTTLGGWERMNG
jgi:hypothetical protein